MMLLVFYLINFLAFALCGECDKKGVLLYEDLGCEPEYDADQQCPIKYSCKGLEPSGENCYFQGKSYKHGELVDRDLSLPSCKVGCFCNVKSSFTCAVLECPEFIGKAHLSPGCYRKYSLTGCCSTGHVCPPFDNVEKCVVDGVEYYEGQKFYPKDTCLKCVCQKGFEGKFEDPFCTRISCGKQLRSGTNIQQSCAPFYSRKWHKNVYCCPDMWICDTNGSEVVTGEAQSEETCIYGNKILNVGQYFETDNVKDGFGGSFEKVKCECVIPPLVKCIDV